MRSRFSVGLFVGLAVATGGCSKQHTTVPVMNLAPPPSQAKADKPKEDGPKRKPQAITCLKMGKAFEDDADTQADEGLRRQRYENARLAYLQALEIEPKNEPAALGLGRTHDKMGNYELAIASYQKALKAHPQSAPMWFEMGMCWGRQKQWGPSVECLQNAVELDSRNSAYATNLGYTLARAGRMEESFEHFRKTVGVARAHYNLALMMQHLGKPEESQQHLRAALEANPRLTEAQGLLEKLAAAPASGNAAVVEVQQVEYRTAESTSPQPSPE